MKEKVVKNLS